MYRSILRWARGGRQVSVPVSLAFGTWFTSGQEGSIGFKEEGLPCLPAAPVNIPTPDLSHSFLVRQASILSVESAIVTLQRTLSAILDLNRSYVQHCVELTALYDLTTDKLPLAYSSDELYGKMVGLKLQIKEERVQLHELELIYQYSKKLLESSIEMSFIAGAEEISIQGSTTLDSIQRTVQRESSLAVQCEKELAVAEKNQIEGSSSSNPSSDSSPTDKESKKALEELATALKPAETPVIDESHFKVTSYDRPDTNPKDNARDTDTSLQESIKITVKEDETDEILITEKHENENDILISDKEDDIFAEEKPASDEPENPGEEEEPPRYKMPTF